jgi:hypothetical protein
MKKKFIFLILGMILLVGIILFVYAKQPSLSFDRNLGCERCSVHKVPGLASVIMNISVTTDTEVDNGVLMDIYPLDWSVADANGGTLGSFNDTYGTISWNVGNVTAATSETYTINAPDVTHPTSKYYFYSEFNNTISDSWMVNVADPASGTTTTNSTITLKGSSRMILNSNGRLDF